MSNRGYTNMTKKTRTFTDLDLNFIKNPISGDINKVYDETAIKRSLKNLIMMNVYDSPFHPEISSQIKSMLFNNFTPDMGNIIQRLVAKLIENFEPRVQLRRITVTTQSDQHRLNLEIEFTIVNNPNPIVFSVLLNRLR
jgi:phage baseplate assembly protein W